MPYRFTSTTVTHNSHGYAHPLILGILVLMLVAISGLLFKVGTDKATVRGAKVALDSTPVALKVPCTSKASCTEVRISMHKPAANEQLADAKASSFEAQVVALSGTRTIELGRTTVNKTGESIVLIDPNVRLFSVRSLSKDYKPHPFKKTPNCKTQSLVGYEKCIQGSTPDADTAGYTYTFVPSGDKATHNPPTATLTRPGPEVVFKGDTISLNVNALAGDQKAGIKKVSLYYNPAYKEGVALCNDTVINGVNYPGVRGKWMLIGEKYFAGQPMVKTTFNWTVPMKIKKNTDMGFYLSAAKQNANKFYIIVNVEDTGTLSTYGTKACTGNPAGYNTCSSGSFQGSCGSQSWTTFVTL